MEKWWLFIVKSCFLCVVEIPEVGSGEVQSCIVCLSVCLSVYVAFREAPKKHVVHEIYIRKPGVLKRISTKQLLVSTDFNSPTIVHHSAKP